MIHRIFVLLLLLMWLPDLYVYRRFLKSVTSRLRLLWWLPSVVLTLSLVCMMFGDNFTSLRVTLTAYYMIVFLTLTVPKCLFVLTSLLGKGLHSCGRLPALGILFKWPVERVFNLLGFVLSCVGAYIIIYGFLCGWRNCEVKDVVFAHRDVPEAFDGYRVVHISDLHVGTIARYPEEISRVVELVNAQQPDLIAFTGDLVNNEAKELEDVEKILSDLHAYDGVFSVLGNHDYGTYRRWPSRREQVENLEELKRRETNMGWHLLLNENQIVRRGGDSIAVMGVENDGKPPFPALGDLSRASQGTDGMFKLLLSHDPSHWRRKVLPETDIQLMLAGHTHAMQFRLGDFSPSAWIYPEWGGLYTEGERGLHVNIGLGSVMIPFRFGAWPEITVITLRRIL